MVNKKRSFRASANIFLLIALAIALPLTIFVAQQQQITQQQAMGTIKIGVNTQGIVHYGYEQMNYMEANYADIDLQEMQRMGIKTVRVFVANNKVSDQEIANRLDNFLTKANSYGISAVINLLHFFDIYGMRPQGIDQYYTDSVNLNGTRVNVLNHDFWAGGYKDRYTQFVRTVVSKNSYHNNIYAWEPCNECRDNDGHKELFLSFMQDITEQIHSLDNAPISSGIEDTQPTLYSPSQFYGALPYVNVVSLHMYNGDRRGNDDAAYAKSAGKKLLIGEIGISKNRGDRASLLTTELNYWESQGADTALLWAFGAPGFGLGTLQDGDGDSGFDPYNFTDYDAIKAIVKKFNGVTDQPTTAPTQVQPTQPGSTTAPQPTTSQQTVYPPHSVTHSCSSADSTVTVYWQGGENATNYYIHLRNQTTNNQQDVLQSPSAGKAKTFSITLGNEYNVWLEAVPNPQNSGAHVFTCDANSTPVPQPTNTNTDPPPDVMPNDPYNLQADCRSNIQVELSWAGGENAIQYFLHLQKISNGEQKDYLKQAGGGKVAAIAVDSEEKYGWWMEAVNGSKSTSSIGGPQFTCAKGQEPPPTTEKPGVPSNTDSNCDYDNKRIILSWTKGNNSIYTKLHINPLNTDPGYDVYGESYVIENASSNSTYTWWAEGVNNNGTSEGNTGGSDINCNFDGDGGSDTPPGTTTAPGNTPTSVPPTATPVPPTPTPIPYPNCINLQGPTTIRLGRTVTYLAQFFAHPGGVLRGGMGAFNINSATPTDPATWNWNKTSDPYSINSNESVLRFSWTPTEIGNYHVFCQSIDDARNISCRGATAATAGEIALCKGPQTSMTVQVVSDEVPSASGRDMCQFATTIGSNAITSYRTVAVSAVAKPQFNIKNYTFAFFNADNQTKPIQFESGKSFKIESPSNTVNLTYNAMHRIDMQTGTYPQNILMKAFFTDIDGNFSNEGTGCNITLLIDDKPVPTRAAPTTGPVETSAPERPGALQLAAGLIGIGTILAAFLTNRERIFEFRSRRRR